LSENRSIPYAEQYANVLQLARDRKNGIGAYHASFKDFSEMGPPQGGNWPFSAESIRLAFGVPVDREDPELSDYELTIRAQTHVLFEYTLQNYLRIANRDGYTAINEIFSQDTGGDRDWEWWQEKAKGTTDFAVIAERKVLQAQGGLILMTMRLIREQLFVEFARHRTVREEEANERHNFQLYMRYKELKSTVDPTTGKTYTTKAAYAVLHKETGLSRSHMEKVVEAKEMDLEGRPKRKPGRPRKEVAQ
jgi:hypothetical protein